ncbi:hypothetical protein [Nonomuraea sediminis]|uniref:hypothetical protein n=1 Tax=Nonomuraea sediminis TaxID=2835864 RepID=UPI001BDC34F0|nr:hypothetical protein [Nonomuraea sediminis]
MWQSLPDEAIDFVEDAGREYGSLLYDYARTTLPQGEAERVVAATLVAAVIHAARLTDLDNLRPWLYGLLRAHRSAAACATSTGSWVRPGQDAALELLPEGLASLRKPQREALDLVHRHGLTLPELALIFDAGLVEVEILVDDAAASLERWYAAVSFARGGRGCHVLAELVSAWERAPRRLARTQIGHHIEGCSTCQAAPRERSAAELLQGLPIEEAPGSLTGHLAEAEEVELQWRPDGFPRQDDALTEVRQDMPFRAWEEVWDKRPDESDPEARLSPLWLMGMARRLGPAVKVILIAGTVVTVVLGVAVAWSGREAVRPTSLAGPERDGAGLAPSGTGVPLDPSRTATGPLDPQPSVPVGQPTLPVGQPVVTLPATTTPVGLDDPPTTPAASPQNTARPTTPPSTARPTKHPSSPPPAPTKQPVSDQPVRQGPSEPPQSSAKRASSKPLAVAALPKPAAPEASLSPSHLDLGLSRSGSFSLECPGASCQVTSSSGTDGVSVSGTSVSVSAKAPAPDCSFVTQQGTVTVSWTGTATGDGKTTQGTTSGSGTLTLTVTYKAVNPATGGYRVYDGSPINNSGTGKC